MTTSTKGGALRIPNEPVVDLVLFDRHDLFNLVALPIIVVINVYYFKTTYKLHFASQNSWPIFENTSLDAVKWVKSTNYWSFQIYVIVDTLWLVLYPQSVPSASAILYHHLGVLVGWNMPAFDQYWAFWAALAALIEMNTFFLVLKRQQGKDVYLVHVLFYTTWVLMRNIVYPICLIFFTRDYYLHSLSEYSSSGKTVAACSGIFLELLIIFLNILNTQWTYDLIRKWVRNDSHSKVKQGL